MSTDNLVLQFDPNTIDHLGISLYSKLPSVISELISNSWDADANYVRIDFLDKDTQKQIIFEDDGIGMSFDELNNQYLVIGRNRRYNTSGVTDKGRKVIGKKGLGKLSVFGICNEIQIRTIKDNTLNEFVMNLNEIKQNKTKSYSPKIIHLKEKVKESSGTKIILRDIGRKTAFNCDEIASSLSKKFLIFDQVKVELYHNEKEVIKVTNELKFKDFKKQFEWKFPFELSSLIYKNSDKIRGTILTLETPIKDPEMKGIYLTSRGKIVNSASFYGLRDTDHFHTYVTGYLEVDFIDDLSEDVISTDRHSLNWEHEETRDLNVYLQSIIKYISSDWKKKRSDIKKDDIKVKHNLEIDEWQNGLPYHEKILSEKIIDPILENSSIDVDDSSVIIGNVIDRFENKHFKEFAIRIAELNKPEEMPFLLTLMEDWKAIEAKQYRDLALSRIEVIKKFEEYLNSDTREVPTLHNFLKQFSWLLDPRILEFKDEVTYSQLLKESFPNEKLEEDDRRIDFLCSNALGGILYVVEIKRSQYRIDEKALEQAFAYNVFLTEKYASQTGFAKVVCYVIGGEKSSDPIFKRKENTYHNMSEVFVKTYRELLEQSKQYHKEFIQVYNDYNK
jgi:hypothetical protein